MYLTKQNRTETTVDLTPLVTPPAIKRVHSETGNMTMTENWQWKLIDENQVPRTLMILDAARITKMVKAGLRNVPGLEIWNAGNIRVTQR